MFDIITPIVRADSPILRQQLLIDVAALWLLNEPPNDTPKQALGSLFLSAKYL